MSITINSLSHGEDSGYIQRQICQEPFPFTLTAMSSVPSTEHAWAELEPSSIMLSNGKSKSKAQELRERTQYPIPFVLIDDRDKAVSIQRRKKSEIDRCLCVSRTACSGLHCGLRSSQLAGELNSIIWGQKGQKVIWGTGSVGPWVCDYEETRLRAVAEGVESRRQVRS